MLPTVNERGAQVRTKPMGWEHQGPSTELVTNYPSEFRHKLHAKMWVLLLHGSYFANTLEGAEIVEVFFSCELISEYFEWNTFTIKKK